MSIIYTSGTYTPPTASYSSFLNNFLSVDQIVGDGAELSNDGIPIPRWTVIMHNNGPGSVNVGRPENLIRGTTNPYSGFAAYPIASGADFTITLSGEDLAVKATESDTTINFLLILNAA